jgi:hypothetical protein
MDRRVTPQTCANYPCEEPAYWRLENTTCRRLHENVYVCTEHIPALCAWLDARDDQLGRRRSGIVQYRISQARA